MWGGSGEHVCTRVYVPTCGSALYMNYMDIIMSPEVQAGVSLCIPVKEDLNHAETLPQGFWARGGGQVRRGYPCAQEVTVWNAQVP